MHEYSAVFLEHEEWPEWFTLDFYKGFGRNDPPCLILGIAKEPLYRLVAQLPKYALLDALKKSLEEDDVRADFLSNVDKPWGFGGVLEPFVRQYKSVSHRHLAEYFITIPRIEIDVDVCEDCNGEREIDGMKCLHCMGTGRKTEKEWGVIDRIAATLHVLGVVLDKPDKKLLAEIDTERKQLLSVMTFFGRGNAYISAVLSRSFGDYVRLLSGQELPEVKDAVKSVYLHMFPRRRRYGDFDFHANVHANGQLIINVPGSACSLYVDGFSDSLHEVSGPIKLNCHNVDEHHQQLSLLCGLAALTGSARRSLYSLK